MRTRIAAVLWSLTLSGPADAQSPPVQFRLTEEMRIDGEAESLIGFYDILVGTDGRVVIPQSREGQFLFYDGRGKKIGVFGRAGQGPGEFNVQGGHLLGWRGDTLWIHDFNQRRVTFVSPDLKLLRTEPWSDSPNIASPPSNPRDRPPSLRAHFLYADKSQLAKLAFAAPDPASGLVSDYRYIIVGPNGDIVREVARLYPVTTRVGIKGQWGVATADVPFASQPLEGTSPDGRWVALVSAATMTGKQGSYFVTVIRSTGDTVFSKSFQFTGVAIPAKAKTDVINAMLQRGRQRPTEGPDAGAWPTEQLAAKVRPMIPTYYAPFNVLRPGLDETIWLGQYSPGPTPRYQMIDGRGNLRGEVVLPPRSDFAAATSSHIWLREHDADNVPSLVRYRISR